jgi:hypothetical protein
MRFITWYVNEKFNVIIVTKKSKGLDFDDYTLVLCVAYSEKLSRQGFLNILFMLQLASKKTGTEI